MTMLTSALDAFWAEYARNRQAGVSDGDEALCLALARVLPHDQYMPVMKMLAGANDREFSITAPFDGIELRQRLIHHGDAFWTRSRGTSGRRSLSIA
ncbi:MAG: hypothetical protein ABSC90_14295 [Acidimicrobiales bacterium]|jgi:hypothetical protein